MRRVALPFGRGRAQACFGRGAKGGPSPVTQVTSRHAEGSSEPGGGEVELPSVTAWSGAKCPGAGAWAELRRRSGANAPVRMWRWPSAMAQSGAKGPGAEAWAESSWWPPAALESMRGAITQRVPEGVPTVLQRT